MQSSSKNLSTNNNPVSAPSPSGSPDSYRGGVGIKICGMKYPDNILEVGSLLPDYMGFIFWEKSARYFDGIIPELPTRELGSNRRSKSIKKVGVFVNATIAEITEKIEKYDLQAVQLHENESVEFCSDLKEKIDSTIEIIKVFSVNEDFDFAVLKPFESVCDYFLFDTKGKLPGGNGTTFDWKILEQYASTKPFFLSGGIGIEELEDVKQVLKTNLPIYAIDINSKFEVEPGLKNVQLCKDAINRVSTKK